jgi:hypothetical protein
MLIDVSFRKKKDLFGRRVRVAVEIEGNSFLGAGSNSKAAKRAAAKYALRDYAPCKWLLFMYLFSVNS